MEKIDLLIRDLNKKLQTLKVSVRKRNKSLSLRATLPSKADSTKSCNHQQEISLHLKASEDNLVQAEVEACKLGVLIAENKFKWEIYDKQGLQEPTIKDLIVQFEEDYFTRHQVKKSRDTWTNDYKSVYKHLPEESKLTASLVQKTIKETPPDTRKRRRYVLALAALAKFAGIEVDIEGLIGNYSPSRVKPRNLPSEKLIVECYHRIGNKGWQWVYGVLATYGLRNHEVFRLDFDRLKEGDNVVSLLEGKTGERRVWPFYPEWFEEFNLKNVILPECSLDRTNSSLGHQVTIYFSRTARLPFNPYSLRHCWAIRTLNYGLDISLAAQQMGHKLSVHSEIYHRWINDKHHQNAFEILTKDPRRLKAPDL
jgi:integrase